VNADQAAMQRSMMRDMAASIMASPFFGSRSSSQASRRKRDSQAPIRSIA
jgi:hypothetical protein